MSEARIGALKTRAEEVRDEQVDSANSATRVGQLLWDMIDYMGDIEGSSSSEDVDVELGSSLSAIKSLTYPPNNNSLLIYNSGSTTGWTYIDKSELGGGGGGGQGQGIDLDAMWQSLSSADSNKVIDPSHLNLSNYVTKGTTWWGRSIVDNAVSGNMEQVGTIQFTNGITLEPITDNGQFYLKLSHNGGGTNVAHFYATGGVSALGMGSSGSGGGGGGDDTSGDPLNYILGDVNLSSSTVPTYYNGNMYALLKSGATGAWSISPLTLNSLGDVVITNPSDGQVLTYDSDDHVWKNADGGTGGATTLEGLNNVDGPTQSQSVNSILYRPSGSTSNPFNNWKDVKFQISGEILHSYTPSASSGDGGIVTQIDLDTKSYRLPVYTAGVTSNSSDTSHPYYLTGSLMVEHVTNASHQDDQDSNGKWKHNFDKTYCNSSVYMLSGALYSEGSKVVTATSLSSTLTGYATTGALSAATSRIGTLESYFTNGAANNALRLKDDTPHTIWGQTYWENGKPKDVDGTISAIVPANIGGLKLALSGQSSNAASIVLNPVDVDRNVISMFGKTLFDVNKSTNSGAGSIEFGYFSQPTGTPSGVGLLDIYGRNITINNTVGNVYIPNANTAAKGLRIGDAILYWDANNQALALTKVSTTEHPGTVGNFYATGGVSALGLSNGTSSIDAMTFGTLSVTTGAAIKALNVNSGTFIANSSGAKLGDNATFELNDGARIQFDYDDNGTNIPIKLSARADGLYISVGTASAKKILTAS